MFWDQGGKFDDVGLEYLGTRQWDDQNRVKEWLHGDVHKQRAVIDPTMPSRPGKLPGLLHSQSGPVLTYHHSNLKATSCSVSRAI